MTDMQSAISASAPISWAVKTDALGVADHVAKIVEQPGPHRIAVPGGNTPIAIFDILSRQTLPWGTVTICLTDDRIVPIRHPASNQAKLARAFDATAAHIEPLVRGNQVAPFDLVWLGMGADGHIASLFPNMTCDDQDSPAVIHTVPDPLPVEAPFERLSLNMAALTATREIILVVRGCDKKNILEAAIAGDTDVPVARLFRRANCPITIFWSRS
ncbi:6-phosphogluconolactonase [Parasphingorhabdus flavimaris]|uniref:6-phosphogluconolactonase n=1 Tax=Parasphingorhabdus flavimaris TaxID=266812 RepID=UPI0030014ECD